MKPIRNKSKKQAYELLKDTLPELKEGECYAWKQTYYENTGCRGTVRDIENKSTGDIHEEYHLCEINNNDIMFPKWANVVVIRHFKIVVVNKEVFKSGNNNKGLVMIPLLSNNPKGYKDIKIPLYTLEGDNIISLFVNGKVTFNGYTVENDIPLHTRDFPDSIIEQWQKVVKG